MANRRRSISKSATTMLVKDTLPIDKINDIALQEVERCKLVVVGDNNSGKTCLLSTLIRSQAELDQMSIFEECVHTVDVGQKSIEFVLWDLSGHQDYDGLRIELYRDTDIFLVCFDIGNPVSLSNAEAMWIAEIKEEQPNTPFLLIGCKNDMRTSNNGNYLNLPGNEPNHVNIVSKTTAERVALATGAKGYVECCAKTRSNIQEVFQTAGEVVACVNTPIVKTNDHHFFAFRSLTRYARRKSADPTERAIISPPRPVIHARRGSVM